MELTYKVIPEEEIELCRDLCNELMAFQKSISTIKPELFDNMNFDTRMIPSIKSATSNYTVIVKDGEKIVAYVYSNISPKENYSNEFATFFNLSSVAGTHVGCLSQFYIREGYRDYGIGKTLFNMSMEWMKQFEDVEDYFVFVSNGNHHALDFYKRRGFKVSHDILDGFITVLRND
ncbi:GNAT family N-acetyltransferase [Pseudalkalibacillus hwajinpoensis]|uniref:GNAT family N-acetyltransferase n=1 Tax=Guptibacillus hwajinpoensis TaxID=208199 RepID=A0A4U1ML45_9BACL|nr:GNAT family N-acetyltransferase [Pseudalkalibacillus hwajinpoensis]TKD72189.1 GNAT family N-acetyltransferase [Pseudalkalibacillus hwajinpoensis]